MTKAGDLDADINFLFEMGNLRHIDRMWKRFLAHTPANVAEHHFRMFWIAMTIAAHEKGVDTAKVAKMVMVHDITESRTGDVDYTSRQYVERNEKLAIKDMLLETSFEKEFYSLWNEYEKRESLESKIVKDADNLDIEFELCEQISIGIAISKKWKETYRRSHVRPKLYTKSAREIFDQLESSDPHAWHLEGRNRINSGDWKK